MADESDDFYQSKGSKSSNNESEEDTGEETALLPKSFFQGKELEVGKKCEVEIVSLYDDEAEVKYVEHKKDDKDKSGSDSKPTPDNDAEASMDRGIERMRMA